VASSRRPPCPTGGGGRVMARPRGGVGGAERAEGPTRCESVLRGRLLHHLPVFLPGEAVQGLRDGLGRGAYRTRAPTRHRTGEGELVAFAAEDAMRLARHVPEPVGLVLLANAFHGVAHNTGLACGVRKVLAPGRGHVRRGQLVPSVPRGDFGTTERCSSGPAREPVERRC
jgi:hypothetical protein